jgi:hypothetical protein
MEKCCYSYEDCAEHHGDEPAYEDSEVHSHHEEYRNAYENSRHGHEGYDQSGMK